MHLHNNTNFLNQKSTFMQTRVDFLLRNYDVISHLPHSYTKGSKSLSFTIADKKLDAKSDNYKDSRMAIIRQ